MLKRIWYALCTTCKPHSSSTVRFAFPLVALALLLTSAAVITQGESYLVLEAEPRSVRAGDTFFVNVSVVAHTPINAVDIVLSFPSEQMRVVGVDTGESVISLWTEEPYAENGKVYMRGGTFRGGFVGEHHIGRVRAEAVESGSAEVQTSRVTFIAGDGEGTEINAAEKADGKTRIYITNEDGSLVGEAHVQIITDIDGDGEVGLSDIAAFMSAWRSQSRVYDFNGDGSMTFRDFGILLADSFFK